MNLLAFDNSTNFLSIAIKSKEKIWHKTVDGGAKSSTVILPLIQEGMAEFKLSFSDLTTIIFTNGPGNFTGLRTACCVAQGLGFGANLKVLPINTLLAMAEEARLKFGLIKCLVVLDARMNEIYNASFSWNENFWQIENNLNVCSPDKVLNENNLEIIGNCKNIYPDFLSNFKHFEVYPTALSLLSLAPSFLENNYLVNPELALPIYIRNKVAKTIIERKNNL